MLLRILLDFGHKGRAAVIAVGFALTITATAYSQGSLGMFNLRSSYRRPSVSRYQNIANFANNPLAASNIYQSMVQPDQDLDRARLQQISQAQQIGGVQSSVSRLEKAQQSMGVLEQTIRPTGHSATFLNYSHYYPYPGGGR